MKKTILLGLLSLTVASFANQTTTVKFELPGSVLKATHKIENEGLEIEGGITTTFNNVSPLLNLAYSIDDVKVGLDNTLASLNTSNLEFSHTLKGEKTLNDSTKLKGELGLTHSHYQNNHSFGVSAFVGGEYKLSKIEGFDGKIGLSYANSIVSPRLDLNYGKVIKADEKTLIKAGLKNTLTSVMTTTSSFSFGTVALVSTPGVNVEYKLDKFTLLAEVGAPISIAYAKAESGNVSGAEFSTRAQFAGSIGAKYSW